MKVRIETHGCKLNAADSQQLAREFSTAGFMLVGPDSLGEASQDSEPDVFVLNSCTVTSVADRKARQAVSAARRKFPSALIVATGCYVERDIDAVTAVEAVDIALGNRNKPEIVRAVVDRLGVAFIPHEPPYMPVRGSQMALPGRTRASVKIQEGCDQVCAYCIVPKVRGRERSVPVGEIVGQVQALVSEGCSEVVLTGTQLGTYGFDLESTSLPGLLRAVVSETDVQRIRVSSLQPLEISDGLLAVWTDAGDRLCPHFHISLQSGSDSVLGRMRRRYTAAQFVDAVARVREAVPGCSVTTDVICAFPGETDQDHEATLAIIESVRFAHAHVFPYSVRPGTSAAHSSDHLSSNVKSERAAEVRELTEKHAQEFKQQSVGQVRPVLWEGAPVTSGLTDNYLRVRVATRECQNTPPNSGSQRPIRQAGLIEQVRLCGIAPDGSMTAELFA
jgi:threonylcarbamoyladenosine tRNA methylthiotransferase MtaB